MLSAWLHTQQDRNRSAPLTPPVSAMANLKSTLDVLLTVAIAAAVGIMVAKGTSTGSASPPEPGVPLPSVPLSLEGAQLRGNSRASIGVLEFSDFECPYCRGFAREVLPELEKTYLATGRVLLAFRQMPLSIHPTARSSAEVAVCAGRQDRFWPLHDWLFDAPAKTDQQAVIQQAEGLGVNSNAMERCLEEDAPRIVGEDLAHANALGVKGTPTFFIGRLLDDGRLEVAERFVGSQRWPSFERAIEAIR